MWRLVHKLRAGGTTIILTTHYIEEAEEMADRVGVIDKGRIILVEQKAALMRKLGKRELRITLSEPLSAVPEALAAWPLKLGEDGRLIYAFDAEDERIPDLLAALGAQGIGYKDLETHKSSLEDIFVDLVERKDAPAVNFHGIWAIYRFEMARALRTLWQSLVTPVITTSLYFVVFGGAIGSKISTVGGVGYGSFIVPGLIMLSLLTQSISNASIGIYFPKFTGTVYELLSAPVSAMEMVIGYVGAAATKSIVLGLIILATASLFVPL
eukprot:gene35405-41775_t